MNKSAFTAILICLCCCYRLQAQEGCRFKIYWESVYVSGAYEGSKYRGYKGSYDTFEECDAKASELVGTKTDRPLGIKELIYEAHCEGCGRTGNTHYLEAYESQVVANASAKNPASATGNPKPEAGARQSAPDAPHNQGQDTRTAEEANPETEAPDAREEMTPETEKAPEKNDRRIAGEVLLDASPGIGQAVKRFVRENRQRRAPSPDRDTKPEGFSDGDLIDAKWVIAGKVGDAEEASFTSERSWETAKGIFDQAAAASELLGYEEYTQPLKSASTLFSYLETVDHVYQALADPGDNEARLTVVKDAIRYTQQYAGTAGGVAGKYSPPVDLHQRTFEGALQRMNSLITTGDAGDEIQVTAPLLNWFGSMTGTGDIGTRESNYRLEAEQSFSELKARYGWMEATKQKVYSWLRNDL